MRMSCKRWTKWGSCILSLVAISLICSLNHYRHHLLRGVFVKLVWWDLERCQTLGEILHIPTCESRSRWLSTQPDVEWIVLFFPYVSFPDVSHIEVFNEAIRATWGDVYYALFLHIFALGFRSFWDIDNMRCRAKGECWETDPHSMCGPNSFLGLGFSLMLAHIYLPPLPYIYPCIVWREKNNW